MIDVLTYVTSYPKAILAVIIVLFILMCIMTYLYLTSKPQKTERFSNKAKKSNQEYTQDVIDSLIAEINESSGS
jgi:hypothetical protein